MTYLTSHRSSAVRKYGGNLLPGSSRPSNLPAPYRPNLRPPHANDNMPRAANTNIPKSLRNNVLSPRGLRLATSFPWFVIDELGYQFLKDYEKRLAQSMSPLNLTGWIADNVCSTLTATHYTQTSGFCNAPLPGVCFMGSISSSARPIGTPLNNFCRLSLIRHTHSVAGVPRYAAVSYHWRNTTLPDTATRILRSFQPWPVTPKPVFNPNALPIYWPVPLPEPIPYVLVPTRLNDPIGSTRNNGDSRPVIHPPRPPGPQTKEVKLRALGGAVGVLQKLHHATTEGLDILDSFHDALPAGVKARATFVPNGLAKYSGWRPATPQAKTLAIWQNFDKLDWNEVVKNLIKNEIEDRILGRANQGANKFLNQAPGGRITRGFAF